MSSFFSCAYGPSPVQPPPVLVTLRQWGIASAVIYAVGIPCVFAFILVYYRREIHEDQQLHANGTGDTPETNKHFSIRRRYNQIYE